MPPVTSTPQSEEASRAYLQHKYGKAESHIYYTEGELNAVVDQVLEESSTVKYLLASLDKLFHKKEVELAIAHELLHAYDYCRVKNLDPSNCHHLACMEVRAANLSGDCSYMQEMLRGNMGEQFLGQHVRCVIRRATKSVAAHPACAHKAEVAVHDMLTACMKDTDPFTQVQGSY